jgi:pyridoxamine 5'-phosphate oxidase
VPSVPQNLLPEDLLVEDLPVENLSSEDLPPEDLAPWRSPLARALHRNRADTFARYVQLATVRADAAPANRTVVFRGFLEGTNALMFISDRRSEKTAQIQKNPKAEVCWYFTKTREQFRLSGQLVLVSAETQQIRLAEARTQLWKNISDSARLQFAWPQPKAERDETAAFAPPPCDHQDPPPTFCLLYLVVSSVDHLELRGEPQNRCLYQKLGSKTGSDASSSLVEQSGTEQWQITAVNP